MADGMRFSLDEGAIVGGTYRVGGLLGRGGMGDVFRVRHERTGATYALKVLNADLTAAGEVLTRFQREAEVTSSLNHPNLVRVFDFDRLPDGRPYLVMELLEGRELAGVLRDAGGTLPLRRVVNLVHQMAMGLAAAHERGIVHRDLKPSNVFVTPLPGSRQELVRILDFGISKVSDGRSHLTRTATIMGTPNYMSPEQALGQTTEIDATTDQWALAAMTFEMLSGRIAFANDEGPLQVLMTVVNGEPARFADLGVAVAPEVEGVILRGLAKKKGERFATVTDFSRALRRAAGAAGVELDEDDSDSDDARSPGDAVMPASASRSPVSAPVVPPTTLRHGTGERMPSTRLLPSTDAAIVTDTAVGTSPRAKRSVATGAVIGVVALGAAAYFVFGRPTPAGPPASAGAVVAAPAESAPAPKSAAPAVAAEALPVPAVAPSPPPAAPPATPPAKSVAADETKPIEGNGAKAPPAVAKSVVAKPAHAHARHADTQKELKHSAPKRVLNEDI